MNNKGLEEQVTRPVNSLSPSVGLRCLNGTLSLESYHRAAYNKRYDDQIADDICTDAFEHFDNNLPAVGYQWC